MDSDGDASNGIQIKPEVLKVLNDVLKGKKDVPKDDELVGVVSEVEQQVPDFKGKVKTKEEVKAHLEKSATQITKELLAGKTFYSAYNKDGVVVVEKDAVNSDATSITWTNIEGNSNHGVAKITNIEGKFVYMKSDGKIHKTELTETNDKYIKFSDNGKVKTFYFTIEDAKAAIN